jgi:hypothetical protein
LLPARSQPFGGAAIATTGNIAMTAMPFSARVHDILNCVDISFSYCVFHANTLRRITAKFHDCECEQGFT